MLSLSLSFPFKPTPTSRSSPALNPTNCQLPRQYLIFWVFCLGSCTKLSGCSGDTPSPFSSGVPCRWFSSQNCSGSFLDGWGQTKVRQCCHPSVQHRLRDCFPKYRNPREHPICEGWGPTVHKNEFKIPCSKKEVVLVSIELSANLKKNNRKHKQGVGWVNWWRTENGF